MKEMEYSIERKIEVLDTGYCLGLLYYIMNLGTHPTAYIRIPEGYKEYKKNYDDIDLQAINLKVKELRLDRRRR